MQPSTNDKSSESPRLRKAKGNVLTGLLKISKPNLKKNATTVDGITKGNVPWSVRLGDASTVLSSIESDRFSCVVTSPPYFWQRDYEVRGQIGKESTIPDYVDAVTQSMTAVKRVLNPKGLLFLNLGDTYYSGKGQPKGSDPKNRARRFGLRAVDASGLGVPRKTAIGIPWRVALEMIASGWILRSAIIWKRLASIPEPTAKDRPWRTHEMVFMFAKSPTYHFNRKALGAEEDIWTISARPKNNNGKHFAAFPDELVYRCLQIGCRKGGEVLDPFAGTGTVLRVATGLGHPATGIDLSPVYFEHMFDQLSST